MPYNKTKVDFVRCLGNTEMIDAKISGYRFPIHFHETFVVQLITGGTDWCCGNKLTAGKGELFVHFPNAPHSGGPPDSKPLSYRAVYPTADLFHELTGADVPPEFCGTSLVLSNRHAVEKAKTLFRRCDEPRPSSAIRSCMRDLFKTFLCSLSDGRNNRLNNIACNSRDSITEKMMLARDHLTNNFTRDVTTAELSDRCDVSPFHLIRTFKSHFGITPRQFLISQRVAASKRMIAAGMSITAAAHSAGFADQSHLTRYFKRITSCNPSQFKQR